jgi:hypothetical protein
MAHPAGSVCDLTVFAAADLRVTNITGNERPACAGACDPDQTDNVPTWQPFTMKLTLRQISETGEQLDRIVVTKPRDRDCRDRELTGVQK